MNKVIIAIASLLLSGTMLAQSSGGGGSGGGGGTGTVTGVTGTAPVVSNGSTTTPALSCPTCVTSAAALVSTQIMTGGGSQAAQTPSSAATLNSSGQMALSQLLVSGVSDGLAPTTVTTGASATVGAGTFLSGYTVNENATAATAITYTLPVAAAGKQYCVENGWNGTASTTGVITLATSATGQFLIFTDGSLSATGGNVTSGGAAADMACVHGVDATHWQLSVIRGTWTKH